MYRLGTQVVVNDRMQKDYVYNILEKPGGNFAPNFIPAFTPKEMLALGIFEGKYCNDCQSELPVDWFNGARISDVSDPALNRFRVKSRQSIRIWQQKGWIYGPDPRGWFQWYCRYWLGRRLAEIDTIQIKRWRAFARHAGQIRANCPTGELSCRPRQRQALLQWAYDPFI